MVRIKICCIKDIHEARLAIELGASAIGLVGRMPSGPGPIPDEMIRQIAESVPPPSYFPVNKRNDGRRNNQTP